MSSVAEPVFLYKTVTSVHGGKNSIKILACRSLDTQVEIPETIQGLPVTELAPYAFSERRAWEEEGQWTRDLHGSDDLPLLCGTRLREIILHKGIEKIGNYAFYNCYELTKLTCSSTIRDLGSGLFTGCGNLGEITITIDPSQKSCLKEILSELRQTLTVHYLSPKGEARLLFPEFYEESVENTPARLLFTETHGCGHRYRYCFEGTHFLFQEYDSVFPYMKAQESGEQAVKLALGRLRYPVELMEGARKDYYQYVEEHWEQAGSLVLGSRSGAELLWLLQTFSVTEEQTGLLIDLAGKQENPEALSCLMNYKHEHFKTRKRRFTL